MIWLVTFDQSHYFCQPAGDRKLHTKIKLLGIKFGNLMLRNCNSYLHISYNIYMEYLNVWDQIYQNKILETI